jgi:arsenate reductase
MSGDERDEERDEGWVERERRRRSGVRRFSTCKKAIAWLDANGIPYHVRPIVDEPPTPAELGVWIPASGLPVRKWLNTSGLSFRALGKAKIDAARDADLVKWLAADGKLVKRPVLVSPGPSARVLRVLVGFKPEAWKEALA